MASPTEELREPAHRCHQCGYVAPSETALKAHQEKHTKKRRKRG